MRTVLVAIALAVAATEAAAQPSQSPLNTPALEVPPVSGSVKSPSTALALSLGGTIGTFALLGIGGAAENGVMSSIGSVGIWVAPSFGHWYAGRGWTTGLKYRIGGAGAIAGGLMWTAIDCIGSGCESDFHPGMLLAIGGGVAFFGGIVHDIATAPRAAREHNARLEGRVRDVTVRPTFGSGRAGLALGGRF